MGARKGTGMDKGKTKPDGGHRDRPKKARSLPLPGNPGQQDENQDEKWRSDRTAWTAEDGKERTQGQSKRNSAITTKMGNLNE